MSTILTFDELRNTVPAIFSTTPSPKLTEKYEFVPTFELLEKFQQEGWNIVKATQTGRSIHSVHEVRLRNKELPKVGDSLIEAIIKNSHNGLCSLKIGAGLHRLVCGNGLTIPTSISSQFNLRHMNFDFQEVKNITNQFAEKLPIIKNSMSKMSEKYMKPNEIKDFATKAVLIRWTQGSVPTTLNFEELVSPVRAEDSEQTVWNIFNRVQEKFVRGGISYQTSRGRKTSLRELKNINSLNTINTKLWELAESYC